MKNHIRVIKSTLMNQIDLILCLKVWRERKVEGKEGKERRVNESRRGWLPFHIVWMF